MMKVRTSLWASLAIAASLGLAGCGGSSNENQQLSAADQCTADGGTFADEKCTLPIDTQRAALKTALEAVAALTTNLSGTPTQAVIDDAKTKVAALKTAIDNAEDVPKEELDAHRITHTAADNLVKAAQVARTDVDNEAQKKATADLKKAGDALYKALVGAGATASKGDPLENITDTELETDASEFSIDVAAMAGLKGNDDALTDATALELKPKSGTVAPLSGWKGAHFARTEGTGSSAFTSDEARVYHNQGAAKTMPFSGTGGKYGISSGGLFAGATSSTTAVNVGGDSNFSDHSSLIKISSFEDDEGEQERPLARNRVRFEVAGTYDGASGMYECTPTDSTTRCTSTVADGKLTGLGGGTWNFRPGNNVMVSTPDDTYLYFGWWVSKNSDGEPTAASAFVGTVATPTIAAAAGDIHLGWGTTPLEVGGSSITGNATYKGAAVGKYAYRDISEGTAHGGHFEADAQLEAKFGTIATAGNGVTGTIDNFRLNDVSDDPGWKVSLNRADWVAAGNGAIGAGAESNSDADGYAPANTTWSINDNPAAVSGEWSGTMYDEKPGAVSDDGPGDGNNIPTTVTGTFYSEFGSEGRMVGAFGATR